MFLTKLSNPFPTVYMVLASPFDSYSVESLHRPLKQICNNMEHSIQSIVFIAIYWSLFSIKNLQRELQF